MTETMTDTKAIRLLGLITLLSLFLNTFRISVQPVSSDDFDVAISAINYMESGQLGPTMWNHPCLRNILVYWALRLFGTGVAGAKGVSILLGTLCTPLIGIVARRIFRDNRVALTAAFLWAVDALVIEFSRQGINDIYLAFFPLAAIYLAFRYRESGGEGWLICSCFCFGLGLASKWSVLFPLLVTLVLLASDVYRTTGIPLKERFIGYCHLAALFLLVPAMVYLLTFTPWFGRGYTLPEWGALQRSMFLETSQHVGYKPKLWDDRDNRAYKWFVVPSLFVDPFFNLDRPDGNQAPPSIEDGATVVLGVANPLVWLPVLPAIFLLTRRGMRERDDGSLYLSGLFLLSYLPLVCSPRPIWLNTALSVLPYAIMAVAWLAWHIARRSGKRYLVMGAYLAAVSVVAAPLYLLATGRGMRIPQVRPYLMERYLKQIQQDMPAAGGPAQ
jgi:dolichyl-phosphate-mannose-protein mannosyltransferase